MSNNIKFTETEKNEIKRLLRDAQVKLTSQLPTKDKEKSKRLKREVRAITEMRIKIAHKSH